MSELQHFKNVFDIAVRRQLSIAYSWVKALVFSFITQYNLPV